MSAISSANNPPFDQEHFLNELMAIIGKENDEDVKECLIYLFELPKTPKLKDRIVEAKKELAGIDYKKDLEKYQRKGWEAEVFMCAQPIHRSSFKALEYLRELQIARVNRLVPEDIENLKKSIKYILEFSNSLKGADLLEKVILDMCHTIEDSDTDHFDIFNERQKKSLEWYKDFLESLSIFKQEVKLGRRDIAPLKVFVVDLGEIYEELSGKKFTFDKYKSEGSRYYNGITGGYSFVEASLKYLYHQAEQFGCYEKFEQSNVITACSQAVTALKAIKNNNNCDNPYLPRFRLSQWKGS